MHKSFIVREGKLNLDLVGLSSSDSKDLYFICRNDHFMEAPKMSYIDWMLVVTSVIWAAGVFVMVLVCTYVVLGATLKAAARLIRRGRALAILVFKIPLSQKVHTSWDSFIILYFIF